MSSCPRCGAENKPGRPSCWNCWSPLPLERPAPAKVVAPAGDKTPTQPIHQERAPLPANPVIDSSAHADVPARPQQASPTVATRPSEPAMELQEPVEKGHGFAYVAPSRKSPNWLLGAITVLCLLAAVVALFWFFMMPVTPRVKSPNTAGRNYLTALVTYDVGTQQQLATEASKEAMLPSWLVFISARVVNPAVVTGDRAKMIVQVTLAPAPGHESSFDDNARKALSQMYAVPLLLQREGDGNWHVDQHAFFEAIHTTLEEENTTVKFPAWE